MKHLWIVKHNMAVWVYISVFLLGLTTQISHGCSDKNVIEALYACSKPRENLNRAGKSPHSTHYQICQAFEQYVNCMEPRVQNCDQKLIEAYTVMKQRYSMDGRFNCDVSPTTSPTTTTTTTTTTELTTEETTTLSSPTFAETTEVMTTTAPIITTTENAETTAVTSNDLETVSEPNSASGGKCEFLYALAISSSIAMLILLLL